MRRLSALLLLAACSDYNLENSKGGNGDAEGDSGFDPNGANHSDDDYEEDVDPDVCEPRTIEARDVTQTDECQVEGDPVGSFTPVVEWKKDTWAVQAGSNQVMMMPAVGSLNDDDGDGDADENDIPDVVVVTYGSEDVIRVVSGDGSGTELLNIRNSGVQGQGGVALGDIDNDGWTDIVAPTNQRTLVAYDHTGTRMWTSGNLNSAMYGTSDNPAIADLDGDGNPEIICGSAIVSNTGPPSAPGAPASATWRATTWAPPRSPTTSTTTGSRRSSSATPSTSATARPSGATARATDTRRSATSTATTRARSWSPSAARSACRMMTAPCSAAPTSPARAAPTTGAAHRG